MLRTGYEIDHRCRMTLCVNPAHLEPVRHRENMRRGLQATKTHCHRGHPLSGANLRLEGGRRARRCRQCERDRKGT
jgi:hypothetical protein